jgi:hypothetical protein
MVSDFKIHPKYKKSVERLLASLKYEGLSLDDTDDEKIEFEKGGVRLELTIDRGRVVQATHRGAIGAERAILDLLCARAIQRPIRDLSEHGLISVEYEMRDPQVSHEVKGLLTPENADPSFQLPLQLARGIYKKYIELHGSEDGKNFWSPRPQEDWQKLGPIEKHKRTQKALLDACATLNLKSEGVEIVEIRDSTRVIISVAAEDKQDFGNLMIQMERILKRTLEPQLELLLESLEDKNKRLNRVIPKTPEFMPTQKPQPEGELRT